MLCLVLCLQVWQESWYLSLDELLPAAQRYDETHLSMYGLVGGMAVMAISLVLLA